MASSENISLGGSALGVLEELKRWIKEGPEPVGILTGSAGTGKTTLLKSVLDWLDDQGIQAQSMAPTGRAARVLSSRTGHDARTIHSQIYSLRAVSVKEEAGDAGPLARFEFPLRDEPHNLGLIIVDEASMVGDQETGSELLRFGSGRLLSDLLCWSRLRAGIMKILFVGDPYQLPPVRESRSPALDPGSTALSGLVCRRFILTDVFRQRPDSAILSAAVQLREELDSPKPVTMRLATGSDLFDADVQQMLAAITADPSGCVGIARSNERCLQHNRAVREHRWGSVSSEPLPGDRLVVVRNSRVGLLNGDIVEVLQVGDAERRAVRLRNTPVIDLAFRRVSLLEGEKVRECMILENLLDHHEGNLPMLLAQALLADFESRTPAKRNSSEYIEALLSDPYVNALLVKYGYCITCHKSQGGEWPTVYVDFAGVDHSAEGFRWSYTAITRARSSLHLIEAPRVSRYSALADASRSDEPSTDRSLCWPPLPEGFEFVKVRNVQYGARYRVHDGGREAVLDIFIRNSGKRTFNLVSGDRRLFEQVKAAAREQEINAIVPGEGELQLLARLIERAPAGGRVRIVGVEPYAATLEFDLMGSIEEVRLTHDREYRWSPPSAIPSTEIVEWLKRTAIE